MRIVIGERALCIADVAAAARGGVRPEVTPELRRRMQRARETLDAHLAGDKPVYGLNTAMGANVGHRIAAEEASSLQKQIVLARNAGVGADLPPDTSRAALFCRVAGLAQGGAGVSLPVFDLLCKMLARDVVPVIPAWGSIGASDLVQTMAIAAAAIGEGRVYVEGRPATATDGLRRTGLAPALLAPKDGLSLGSASSVTLARAALAVAALDVLAALHVATAALACQGFGAIPNLFDARVAAARPAAMQVDAAALYRRALAGTDFFEGTPDKVQDAISFRALPQVGGMLLSAIDHARREVEIELNSAADNPLTLPDDGAVLPSANFMTSSIALAFDTLAIAVAQLATASVQRSIKLMTGRLSGLPNYLSPVGGPSAGFVPMQKTLAALQAEIKLRAAPASIDAVVVSDMVEDIGSNSMLAVSKLSEQLEPMRWVVSIEAMLAAQAVDLRRGHGGSPVLGSVTGAIHEAVRSGVPVLMEDGPTGAGASEVHRHLWSPDLIATVRQMLGQVE